MVTPGVSPAASFGEEDYEFWSLAGANATRRGDFGGALAAYERAHALALTAEDRGQIDKSALNLAMVRLQLGEARAAEEGLREILLRTTDSRLGFTAAYNLACGLRRQGRYERALVYARRAMEKAGSSHLPELLAPAHNLLGNILLNQNDTRGALVEYEAAIALQCGDTSAEGRYLRATFEENLGYCLLLLRRLPEGTARIRFALELALEVRDLRCRAECLQDLCYALLLQGQYDEAMRLGEEALGVARDAAYDDIIENCHYLLGELGSRTGDDERRDHHFGVLQSAHPELPFLRDFLGSVDVTAIITLKR